MGFLDDALDKGKARADQHDEQVDDGIEKAGDLVDDKTGDKYDAQVDKAQDFLQDRTGGGDTNP